MCQDSYRIDGQSTSNYSEQGPLHKTVGHAPGKIQGSTITHFHMQMGDGAASPPNIRNFDYRFRGGRRHRQVLDDDVSLMTYTGHTVAETLIRARFSPQHSTGQRYIYSGSADGCIYVFDCLTGDITARLEGHSRTVRDVSWHPTAPILTGSAVSCCDLSCG